MNKYERALEMLIPDEVDDELVDDYQGAINDLKELIKLNYPDYLIKLTGSGWCCPRCAEKFLIVKTEMHCPECGQLLTLKPKD